MRALTDHEIRIMREWSKDNPVQVEWQRRVEEAARWMRAAREASK